MADEQTIVTVTGVADVQKFLAEAPKTIVMAGFAKALRAGINVIAAELYSATPERDEGMRDENEPHLKDRLDTEVIVDTQGRGGYAGVGFGKETHRANWVEYGHRMVGHRPDKKHLGFVPPHPFIRPTFDKTADKAIEAFAESIKGTIETEFFSG